MHKHPLLYSMFIIHVYIYICYPVEQRNVVKQVRVGKGKNSKHFTQPWSRFLWESER